MIIPFKIHYIHVIKRVGNFKRANRYAYVLAPSCKNAVLVLGFVNIDMCSNYFYPFSLYDKNKLINASMM